MSLPPTGRVLFTYKGPSWYENIDFDMKIVHTQAQGNVRRVSDQFFRFVTFELNFKYFFLYVIDIVYHIIVQNISERKKFFTILAWINSKMKRA